MRQIEQEENTMSLPMIGLEKEGYLRGHADGHADGHAKGHAKGHAEGQQQLVLRLLKRKVGPLSDALEAQVVALSPSLLLSLSEALLDFTTSADLQAWLQEHA
ncbi:hypothetical protein CJ255_07670 [Candidatus Viridilinea mediisalina]|uniref:DUF4351 domain-containing protein n=2 Tax=Candidatus Viridilinea mediisalina TaxID=2024553 RepID=A0A2A6RLH2_9CHLR|nr:hypothetical protein CJ255_07670 [Candidatus Viridilinea mediisalina]